MNESNENSTMDSSDESNNIEDNRLEQYMSINKELSKTIVSLKAENARLRNKNKELNQENFTHQNEILTWKKKFASLQTMHIQHCTMLTGELQSYAEKLSDVFGSEQTEQNNDDDITNRDIERPCTSSNSASTSLDSSRRVSRSFELPRPDVKLQDTTAENPSSLNTINEECEDVTETSNLYQISLITSTYESTIIQDSNSTKTNVDSNKENERPSTFMSSTQDENVSTLRPHDTLLKSINKSASNTPLKEKFVTQRRGCRTTRSSPIQSFDNMNTAELVSSNTYKGKKAVVTTVHNSPVDISNTRRTRSGEDRNEKRHQLIFLNRN